MFQGLFRTCLFHSLKEATERIGELIKLISYRFLFCDEILLKFSSITSEALMEILPQQREGERELTLDSSCYFQELSMFKLLILHQLAEIV